MESKEWARDAVPHDQMARAVDKLLAGQEVRFVRISTASGTCRESGGVVIPKKAWDAARWLASGYGVAVGEVKDTLGWTQANCFGAALRRGAAETATWPAEDRKALRQILDVVGKGQGLSISPAEEPGPATKGKASAAAKAPKNTGLVVIIEPAQVQNSDSRVVFDREFWGAVCALATSGGYSVCHERVIPQVDARLFSQALRRGAGDFSTDSNAQARLWQLISLLEEGGVVLTWRNKV